MIRLVLVFTCFLMSAPARSGEVQNVLSLWGSQGGTWSGHIDIYRPGSSDPQRVALMTRWDAVPDYAVVTKIETFTGAEAQTSAVTLMFADSGDGNLVTPYFTGGKQRDYRFAVSSVSITDETHWTTVIVTPGEQETYEGRPAMLRYVRTRRGNVVENTKEVRFLDGDDGGGEYQLRSFILQSRSP